MIDIVRNEGNFVAVTLSGKLHDEDYKKFVPILQSAADKGKLHLLLDCVAFEGWDTPALWDDIKLDMQLGSQIERIAMIGDKKWESWLAKIWQPFTSAQIQYFTASDSNDAWAWVQDGL